METKTAINLFGNINLMVHSNIDGSVALYPVDKTIWNALETLGGVPYAIIPEYDIPEFLSSHPDAEHNGDVNHNAIIDFNMSEFLSMCSIDY